MASMSTWCKMQISSSFTNMPVLTLLNCPLTVFSDYPNCPKLGGTCQYIHVGEDMSESEVEAIVSHQLGDGKPANGYGHKSSTVPNSNGRPQRQENRPPKASKPQEQAPLCKFGASCTKPECPFAHPTPAAGTEGLVLRGEMCPDGRDCLNKEVFDIICSLTNFKCDMGHPSPAVEGVKRKETENCKFFPNCTNPDCPYKQ